MPLAKIKFLDDCISRVFSYIPCVTVNWESCVRSLSPAWEDISSSQFSNFIDVKLRKNAKSVDWRKGVDGMKHGEVVSDW